MAYVTTKEQGPLATSNTTIGERIATRYFLVFYDAPATPAQAEIATGVPVYGQSLPDDDIPEGGNPADYPPPRRVKTITAKAWDDANAVQNTIWQVQVDYSNKPDVFDDPLSVPPEINWDFSDATQTYFMDNSSTPKPTVNSAGQGFEQLLERETGTVVVTFKRNQASFDVAQALDYVGDDENGKAVNSDGFTIDGIGILAGCAIIGGITAGAWKTQGIVRYREVSYTLKLRKSWDDKIADTGFYEKVSGKLTPIMMASDDPNNPPKQTEKPWPLDGSGAKKTNASDTPATLTFKPYKPLPFSVFSFS